MIVYGSSLSPFGRKVLAFAAEKGIEVESKPVGLGSEDPEFREASPFGKIPGFRDGDFAISDSTAIIAYLDAIRPEANLPPPAPHAPGAPPPPLRSPRHHRLSRRHPTRAEPPSHRPQGPGARDLVRGVRGHDTV